MTLHPLVVPITLVLFLLAPSITFAQRCNGELVRSKDLGGRTYIVEGGKRRWIPKMEVFNDMGCNPRISQIKDLSGSDILAIPEGPPIPISFAQVTCGILNPTRKSTQCRADVSHAECHCDYFIGVSWPQCSCQDGSDPVAMGSASPPAPPRTNPCSPADPKPSHCVLEAVADVQLLVVEEDRCGGMTKVVRFKGRLRKDQRHPITPGVDRIRYSYSVDPSDPLHETVGSWCHNGNTVRVP